MYLIITTRTIHHEGDERSRQYPGHGYPAWTEDVKDVKEFEKYEDFLKEVTQLAKRDTPMRLFKAEPMKVTKTIEVSVE